MCHDPYDHEQLEARLVALAQARTHAYQMQDIECGKCHQVKRSHLATRCDKCAGSFVLRMPATAQADGMTVFANVAEHRGFIWLAEVVAHLGMRY